MAHRIIVGFRFCSDRFAKSGRGKRDKYNSLSIVWKWRWISATVSNDI
ncbi:hypothetical protein LEP1GSC005_1625 [Leptospira santarosai str. ST188]|nr:hypothetical protein LEP1GSC005_1625 [Leptospira santarosai str. ST188]